MNLIYSSVFSIDDILADSDSDMDEETTKKDKPEEKKSRKPKGDTYIRESEDSIVDLADPNAFNKITSKSSIPCSMNFMNNI